MKILNFLKMFFTPPLRGIICAEYVENPILVALSGKKGCGKSTLANHLVQKYNFIRLSFAEELKRLCLRYFPSIMAENKETYRKLLQEVGVFFRKWNPYVWINFVTQAINHHLSFNPNVRIVIDDLRYKNEAHELSLMGFYLIRIERSPWLRAKAGYDICDPHKSETDLDDWEIWDLVIQNNEPYPFLRTLSKIVGFLKLTEV